jgi:hypothetical protein
MLYFTSVHSGTFVFCIEIIFQLLKWSKYVRIIIVLKKVNDGKERSLRVHTVVLNGIPCTIVHKCVCV